MKKIFLSFIAILCGSIFLGSCVKDLDTVPLDKEEITAGTVFDDPGAYKQFLAKIYAGLAVSGQAGPAGQGDISGIDEGFGQYLRGYWYLQELPTDEAVIGWNDQTIKDFHWQTWGSSDVFIAAMYYRIYYQITLCNQFLVETTDQKLSDRGVSDELKSEINLYRAEVRFMRALSYWHALDLFGNVPFVTDEEGVGAFLPERITRPNLFTYIETELQSIENQLKDPRTNEYGRADKAAAWTLLAKLYLNAEVYLGPGNVKYTECLTYCNKVINAGYQLVTNYQNLFLADNNNLSEIIFSINYDGEFTQTYGGTTFIIKASVGGSMNPGDYGVNEGWGGLRTTSAFVNKFADITGETDSRAFFFTNGQNLEIEDISSFNDGYAITKFRNVNSTGSTPSNLTFCYTDFPMFRLADVYLMYAEAVLNDGAGGDMATAVGYVNDLLERAYGNSSANVTTIDLQMILDERARELYWEGHRRTDLIRYGMFTGGSYVWPWKGKIKDGIATDGKYDLYPIPASDLGANPNLIQNTGY